MVCTANVVLHVALQMSHNTKKLDVAQCSFNTAAHLGSSS
jgi:hypothetical protein